MLSGLRGAQLVLQIGLLIVFILYVAALLTRGGDAPAAVALTLLAVIIMNVALILNLSRAQSDEIGNTQLDVISSDLQDTITEAQTHVLRGAIGAEQLMESGASREALSDYLNAQRDKYLANPDFMNVYIAGRNWHIIPDFEAPENFHASERVWYIGAQDCPGEVYISEPYVDASTGDMCFTVSTLLSDGETVAGMDLNFSKAQESILRMTRGRDQTAMIVTSGGLIAGYTDMSMVVSLVIVLAFCVGISINWGNSRMNREADSYENQLDEWLTQQRSILCMFTNVISADPEIMSDYEGAVRWLDDVSGRYPDISLCYMANPYAEHPVIKNNGWEPGEEERPETRPWYRETERSADGFNISAPYLDAQSGNYCVTLSRVVYGPQGEFLGIFDVDFFLDKLINVLGESYTSRSYAFLVDSDGVIINHPNAAYQMGETVATMRNYTSRLMACLSRKTGSGFTVVVANRWWNIYGSVVVVALVVLALFGACLGFVVALINRLIRWQAQTNRRLVAAAEEARDANRAKSQFLSQMSHEIRTPMNAIIGLDSIALRDGDLPPRARDALEKIGSSARHLLSLINDILDMSRIESGRMTLREDRFAFGEFLEQICVIVGGQCEDKGLILISV